MTTVFLGENFYITSKKFSIFSMKFNFSLYRKKYINKQPQGERIGTMKMFKEKESTGVSCFSKTSLSCTSPLVHSIFVINFLKLSKLCCS